MSKLIGQSLGRYHILEQLGEGGMAIVYKAYDTRLESDVAVKVIRIERLAPEILQRAMKRFEREAKSLAQLTHPNLVKVLDYGEYEGQPYLVMPYLPGGTLKQKMKGRPMEWQIAARLLIPIARALDYAHKRGLIHRDVKPSNILITESGEPMLTDFGVAKIIDEEATVDLTGTSAAVGTPEYMAPEQATSKNLDHRADIYALGIVFYEMVTGRRPFQADTPLAVLFKHASESLPRPTQFVPNLPESVEKILLKALAKKPEDRYQNAGEMAQAMESQFGGVMPVAKPRLEPAKPQGSRLRENTRNTLATIDQTDTLSTVDEGATVDDKPIVDAQRRAVKDKKRLTQSGVSRYWAAAVGVIALAGCILFAIFLKSTAIFLAPATEAPTNTVTPTSTNTLTPTKTSTPTPLVFSDFELGLDSSDWPMDSHDASGTNYNSVERVLYPPLSLIWKKTISTMAYIEQITVSGGLVALTGSGPNQDTNQVYMLDIENGNVLWDFTLSSGGGGSMNNAALFGGNKVFFGGQGDTNLYALIANSGNVAWTHPNISGFYASELVTIEDRLYIPDEMNGIVSLTIDGNPIWGDLKGSWGQKVVVGKGLAIGVFSDRGSLVARYIETGIKKWQFDGLTSFFTELVTDGEKIYVNSTDSEIVALDLQTGEIAWRKKLDIQELGGGGELALADRLLCVTIWKDENGKGGISCLDAEDGEIVWSFSAYNEGVLDLAIANGVVYVSSWGDYSLYALNLMNGDPLWSYSLPCDGGDLAIAQGVLYISSCNTIFALGN